MNQRSDFPETDEDRSSDCAEELALFDLTETGFPEMREKPKRIRKK